MTRHGDDNFKNILLEFPKEESGNWDFPKGNIYATGKTIFFETNVHGSNLLILNNYLICSFHVSSEFEGLGPFKKHLLFRVKGRNLHIFLCMAVKN
jgi:hypothetical protein